MVVRKLSISLSIELSEAVRELADAREEDVSPLFEVLLREHPLVITRINRMREARLAHPRG